MISVQCVLPNIFMAFATYAARPTPYESSICFGRRHRRRTVSEVAMLGEECCTPLDTDEPRRKKRRQDGSMPLTGSEHSSMIPPKELVERTRRLRSSSLPGSLDSARPILALEDRDVSDEEVAGDMDSAERSKIGKQLDLRVWEVMQREVMDWYEPSQLHSRRGYRAVSSFGCASSQRA